jgi:ABC-type glycerol-3-phosphate transport system substrate-binding protein
MKRRLACLLLLCVVLLTPLLGCAPRAPEPVVITFACPREDATYYEALRSEFAQACPEVTVELLPLSPQLIENLNATDADVLATQAYLRGWLERGGLVSLDGWVEQDKAFDLDDIYPGLADLYRRDGQLWAIPIGVDFTVTYYNRELCDHYQVPYPQPGWTWDDFVDAAVQLRDPALDVYGYCPAPSLLEPILFAYQHGGRLVDEGHDPPRLAFDDPLVIEALEWYDALTDMYHVAPTRELARQAFTGDSTQAFYRGVEAGKVALWTDSYSARGGGEGAWSEPWPFAWGMTTLPREQEAATMAITEALAISMRSEHPEACWQWISFVSRQVPNRLAPARRSLAKSSVYEEQVGVEIAAVVNAALDDAVLITPDLLGFRRELWGTWRAAMEEMLSGRATAREAMEWAQQQVESP